MVSGIRGDRLHEGFALEKGIRNLTELQSLDSVDLKTSHPEVIEELAELHQLKRLGVVNLNKDHLEKFSHSLSKLSHLRYLRLQINSTEAVVGCLDSVSPPPEHLRTIKLYGWIEKLPAWFNLLHNLTEIVLCNTQLVGDDAIDVLQELPSLMAILLSSDSCIGITLIFKGNKFPMLKALKMEGLKLDGLDLKEGSLQQLETLQFTCCQFRNNGITGIKFPLKLKKVVRYGGDRNNTVANQAEVLNQLSEHVNHPAIIWR